MAYRLKSKPKSNDFDLLEDGESIGQVISSANGFTVYLLGDLEALLDAAPTAEAALESFEAWAAVHAIPEVMNGDPARESAAGPSDPG